MLVTCVEHRSFDFLLDAYRAIESNIQWTDFGHKGRQAGLQHRQGEDPWTSAVGKSRGNELSYTEINPLFKGTEFEKIIQDYGFKRTRLMWVGPYACYSMHRDQTPRLHIPLITNPQCYFVFAQGNLVHLPADGLYWVDTKKFHTFMNCSDQHRLHMVGVVDR
jgi:hypothetical protein